MKKSITIGIVQAAHVYLDAEKSLENVERVLEGRITLDTSGHYNRADLFNFEINNERKEQ